MKDLTKEKTVDVVSIYYSDLWNSFKANWFLILKVCLTCLIFIPSTLFVISFYFSIELSNYLFFLNPNSFEHNFLSIGLISLLFYISSLSFLNKFKNYPHISKGYNEGKNKVFFVDFSKESDVVVLKMFDTGNIVVSGTQKKGESFVLKTD